MGFLIASLFDVDSGEGFGEVFFFVSLGLFLGGILNGLVSDFVGEVVEQEASLLLLQEAVDESLTLQLWRLTLLCALFVGFGL